MLFFCVFLLALLVVSTFAYVPAQVKLFTYSVDFFLKKPTETAQVRTSKLASKVGSAVKAGGGRTAMMGGKADGKKVGVKLEKGRLDRPDPTPELYVEEKQGFWDFLKGNK